DYEVGLRYSESITATVVAVAELGRYDVRRRGFLHDAAFLAVAAIAPSRDWLLAVLDATEPRPRSRIGELQVQMIRETFAAFDEAHNLYGGGHARHALAEYLTSRVLPMLRDADPARKTGAALFAAASEQTDLLGWMAIDDDRPALGQRYLIQSLRLAQESGDIAFGAQVLADMSQANRMLGHAREALQLAVTGRHGLARAYSPAPAARLLALQARAHAALGNAKAATHAVVESERACERIDPEAEPEWARFIDAASLNSVWADTFVDLGYPAEAARFARRSIAAATSQNMTPCAALSQAMLARAALIRRDLDAALQAAHQAVDLSAMVQSSRCLAAVRDLQSRITPYRSIASARDFGGRAHEVLTKASLN
ncbi:MAG: transcriptional regulator, partial [Actinobacteria bacterium]|nr:transcriptional regulator [Actinomycetota bacterium]